MQDLLDALDRAGYRCVGPKLRDGAIVYEELRSAADFPKGVSDTQSPGSYRIGTDTGERRFAWANGPQALKPLLFAPRAVLWRATRHEDGRIEFLAGREDCRPLAVIGARACDLAALELQD